MNRLSLSILILFIIVLAIYVPGWIETEPDSPISDQDEAWQPNYQANNMRSTFYNQAGEINHLVYARKMEHYQLLGFTLFELPQYTIYVTNQPNPWRVKANEGTLYEDNLIRLEADVEIKTTNRDGFVQTITTQFLEINLGNKTMMSDQAVKIEGQDFVINSNGFTANLETQQYEFKDHVQTVYEPH